MAMRRWVGLPLVAVLLCGCTNPFLLSGITVTPPEGSGETAAAGSAEMQKPAQESAAEQSEDLPLAGYVICLDAGHGITEQTKSEAVSPRSEEQKAAYVSGASGTHQTEEQLNLAVAQLVQKRLEKRGAEVVMTRKTHHAAVSNIERAEIANAAKADLCIRIHADGTDDTTAQGISTLIPAGELLGTPDIAEPSREAAQCIQDAMVERTGAQDRGLVERSDLTGFNWSEVPTVLVEMGFLSNPEEEQRMSTETYRKQLAKGIAKGAEKWLLAQS